MPVTEISFAEDLAFVGAQSAGLDKDSDLPAQLAAIGAKLTAVLGGAGLTFDDVVKIGVFYHQSVMAEEASLLANLKSYFTAGKPLPVLTAIPLHHLPQGGLVQIELVALHPGSRCAARRKAAQPDPVHGFSQAVRWDDLIFVGAKMAVDDAGKLRNAGDMAGQARVTMDNLQSALRELGADPQSVVKLNTYYVGHGTTEDWSTAARVRSDAFVKPGPGATGVPVPGPFPDGIRLRQEAIAVVNEDGTPKHRDTSWPEGVWDWPIPVSFEQGLRLEKLIILGGQISASTSGQAVFPGDLKAQTRRTMETIEAILGGFNKTCDCLAKLTIFYATQGDPSDLEAVLDIVGPFFSQAMPALTLVPLAKLGLDGLEIEIEGIGIDG